MKNKRYILLLIAGLGAVLADNSRVNNNTCVAIVTEIVKMMPQSH